jgi:AcrR family transcriptional regulator
MTKTRDQAASLKEACVQAAREVIAESGVENLSMRDVARKLGVSHQAPYRHFESRDHLLAEIMQRCFVDFGHDLDQRPRSGNPEADLGAMGQAYLDYAQRKPLEYRLMFGTPWPAPAQHQELVRHAIHAFNLLRAGVRSLHGLDADHAQPRDVDHQAMFIWSALHGMASITQANVMQHLSLASGVEEDLRSDILARIGLGLRWSVAPDASAGSAAKPPRSSKKARA